MAQFVTARKRVTIQGGEQFVQQGLQAALEGTEQERNQYGKGENALSNERLVMSTMSGNEG